MWRAVNLSRKPSRCILQSLSLSSSHQRNAVSRQREYTASHFQSKSSAINVFSGEASRKNQLTVTLIGRPNVGKSTLFNRLTKTRKAIVSNIPGTTRDRSEGVGNLAGLPFSIIDTGGLDDRGAMIGSVVKQVEQAIVQSDVILFMLDAREGITSVDRTFAKWIRETTHRLYKAQNNPAKHSAEIVLVANKVEGSHLSDHVMDVVSDSYRLGFGEPLLISASHGDGLADLATHLIAVAQKRGLDDGGDDHLEKTRQKRGRGSSTKQNKTVASDTSAIIAPDNPREIQLAIMGRPNVGKSTLLNRIVGDERVITGPVAGLTRDAIAVTWTHRDCPFRLVDTAGLTRLQTDERLLTSVVVREESQQSLAEGVLRRRKNLPKNISLPGTDVLDVFADPSQFSAQISEMSLISALNALRFAQVVMIVVEADQRAFRHIDLQLARKCLQEGRAVFIAANKVDVAESEGLSLTQYEKQVEENAAEYLRDFGSVPVVACSGLNGRGVNRLLNVAMQVHEAWDKRVDTWVLNDWLKELMVTAPTARAGDKAIKIKYMTQVKGRPPTFTLFTNVKELPPFFERFLRSRLQQDFQLKGVPVRFIIRKSEGREAKKALLKFGKQSKRGRGFGDAKGRVGPNRTRRRLMMVKDRKKSDQPGRMKVMNRSEERRRRASRNRGQRRK